MSHSSRPDPSVAQELLPLVYDELRRLATKKLAHESPGQTLQTTALVHEAYLRLVRPEQQQRWESRWHFFSAAAEAMRRILIERARRKRRAKHGGDAAVSKWSVDELAAAAPSEQLLALDDALRQLELTDPRKAELIKLRYYAGMTIEEAADLLRISRTTAHRHWTFARAWLHREITKGDDSATQ